MVIFHYSRMVTLEPLLCFRMRLTSWQQICYATPSYRMTTWRRFKLRESKKQNKTRQKSLGSELHLSPLLHLWNTEMCFVFLIAEQGKSSCRLYEAEIHIYERANGVTYYIGIKIFGRFYVTEILEKTLWVFLNIKTDFNGGDCPIAGNVP